MRMTCPSWPCRAFTAPRSTDSEKSTDSFVIFGIYFGPFDAFGHLMIDHVLSCFVSIYFLAESNGTVSLETEHKAF